MVIRFSMLSLNGVRICIPQTSSYKVSEQEYNQLGNISKPLKFSYLKNMSATDHPLVKTSDDVIVTRTNAPFDQMSITAYEAI